MGAQAPPEPASSWLPLPFAFLASVLSGFPYVFEFFFHENKLWFSAVVHIVTQSKLLL